VAAHKSGAPFDILRQARRESGGQAQDDIVMVSLSNHQGDITRHMVGLSWWVCHGELVESMTAKLHPLLKAYVKKVLL